MRTIIKTDMAPEALGPYSQAKVASHFVFTAGQLPLDPETGELIEGSITEQTEQVFDNLEAILQASDASLDDIVKTTVYVMDLNDFPRINGVYAGRFTGPNYPARSFVQVAELPKGARVEIDAIAYLSGLSSASGAWR